MIIHKENLTLFKGVDLSTRRIPYLVAETGVDGPTICLTAAIHGDEVTGTAVIGDIFKRLEEAPLKKGKLYGFPILNPSGFESISRSDLYAEADLNRNFPGKPDGSTAERLAWKIFSALRDIRPDYVIDLHSDSLNSILYTLVDDSRKKTTRTTFAESALLAARLGITWVVDNEETAGYPPEECLTGSLIQAGIPAVTMELGAPNIIMPEARVRGTNAIWNLLCWMGMIESKKTRLPYVIPPKVWTISKRIYTQSTGIVTYKVKPGQRIRPGKLLGKVSNVFSETIEMLRSPVEGILLSHEDQSICFPGKELFTLAVLQEAKQLNL